MIQPRQFGITAESAAIDTFKAIARRSDMSDSLFFEALIANLELTDQGIPSWVPPLSRDGELPIDAP